MATPTDFRGLDTLGEATVVALVLLAFGGRRAAGDGAVSVCGVPPLAGFLGKVAVLRAGAAAEGLWVGAVLVALGEHCRFYTPSEFFSAAT